MKTGEVQRTALYEAQNMDHPRVNPYFYSRKTRYVYFNASDVPSSPGEAGPPQVCVTGTRLMSLSCFRLVVMMRCDPLEIKSETLVN